MTYDCAAQEFLLQISGRNLVIPDIPGRVAFPWDLFCQANPGLEREAKWFCDNRGYELSEYQCSWAVMEYRRIKTGIAARAGFSSDKTESPQSGKSGS